MEGHAAMQQGGGEGEKQQIGRDGETNIQQEVCARGILGKVCV